MFHLGSTLSITAFQGEVTHYSLSLATSKSDAVSPKRRACIPSSPVYPFMVMQPPPPPGNLSWFSSLNWQKSNRTKKCVYAGDIDLNWLSRDMLLLAHGKGQAKSGGGTVVESRNRRIFLSWCLQSVIFSIMCDFLLSWADSFIGLLCGQEDAGRGWTGFAAKRIQRGSVLVWNLLQLLTLLTFCIW